MGVGDKVSPGKATVADSKPETPGLQSSAAAESQRPGKEQPVGKVMSGARENRGLSAKDVAREAHVPEHYIKMIETDDYSLIADQLYLLPFLRRYAQFVGLDPEEITGRFVRDVQRADVNAARMSDPIPMIERKRRPNRGFILVAIVAVAVGMAIAFLVVRHEREKLATGIVPGSSAARESVPSAQVPPANPAAPAQKPAPAVSATQ